MKKNEPPKPQSLTTTSQHDRFLETARELSADKNEGALDRVFGKVVPPVVPKPADGDTGPANEDGRH